MANIQINIVENGTTTLLTNGCICDRDIDVNVDIPTGGGNREDFIPDEGLAISGNLAYKFANGTWDWFVNKYGNEITTNNITMAQYMFSNAKNITEVPFEFNFGGAANVSSMFAGCSGVQSIGKMKNLKPSNIDNIFNGCNRLRYLPEFENLDLTTINTQPYASSGQMFNGCSSLREVPEDFLKKFYGKWTSQYSCFIYNTFNGCYVLDEVRGFNPNTGAVTANMFGGSQSVGAFSGCYRLKNIIFATDENGNPYVVQWKNQTIDLTTDVGYLGQTNFGTFESRFIGLNSGITADKRVYDDATYQALKNDPDWYSMSEVDGVAVKYSRYNHDSAVATINSLPDTSAYGGGTNKIRFKGESGSLTDGGAISNLTEEEIAVATAKGWTVEIV